MSSEDEIYESLVQELRRGSLVLCVLSELESPHYGYSLVTLLAKKGLDIEPGTLYPLLRRLEGKKVLVSKWETDGSKPRKYYELSKLGKNIYQRLCEYWLELVHTMNQFIKGGNDYEFN